MASQIEAPGETDYDSISERSYKEEDAQIEPKTFGKSLFFENIFQQGGKEMNFCRCQVGHFDDVALVASGMIAHGRVYWLTGVVHFRQNFLPAVGKLWKERFIISRPLMFARFVQGE